MSPVLPFDIAAIIIDIVGENNDMNLLKELALVSHSFLQISSKHLFATIELQAVSKHNVTSSKRGFIKLLQSRPDVVNHIRKLTYMIEPNQFVPSTDDELSPILPNFLQAISGLNYLKISAPAADWIKLDSSLKSALLHLMHLPTINHIELSYIYNFQLSNFTPSVNLLRLDMTCVFDNLYEEEFIFQLEMMPKLREFHTSDSSWLTTKLLKAKGQDGQPAFNLKDLRRLSLSSDEFEDEWNNRYLLQNVKLLEKLHFSFGHGGRLVGLHDLLSPSAHTLKVLDLTVFILNESVSELCVELEAMAGHNILEALSFDVHIHVDDIENCIRSIIEGVEKALVKPGWSALRQVSFEFSFGYWGKTKENVANLSKALQQYLPDKHPNISKLKIVAINSSYVVKCELEL